MNRDYYLQTIGISRWARRSGGPLPTLPAEAPIEPPSPGPRKAVLPAGQPGGGDSVTAPADSSPVLDCGRDDWTALAARVRQCTACELHRTRSQTVFGVGSQDADWLIIGEAPGADEDRQGEPFVGRAGQLLNAMLKAVDLERRQVYIANILKCRPPNNRDPRPEEVLSCEGYLRRQVELVRPKLILAVGRVAAQNLLKTDTTLSKMRGRLYYYGKQQIPVVVTYHPAYLLRSPGEKRKAWEDLKLARRTVAAAADQQGSV